MPRPPRLLLSLSYYHVMTRGNNLNTVFRHDRDYHRYIELLSYFKQCHPFDLYHYCLMPNHTHFLIKTKSAKNFSTFMKRLNLSYMYHFKRQYGWIGHFWQDRYKSQPVGKDEYFIQCGKYIELNPVRAGIVTIPQDYQYSSYNYYAQGLKSDLITEDLFYQELEKSLKERQQRYQKLLIDEGVINTYKKKSWGSKEQRDNEARKIRYNLTKNYHY